MALEIGIRFWFAKYNCTTNHKPSKADTRGGTFPGEPIKTENGDERWRRWSLCHDFLTGLSYHRSIPGLVRLACTKQTETEVIHAFQQSCFSNPVHLVELDLQPHYLPLSKTFVKYLKPHNNAAVRNIRSAETVDDAQKFVEGEQASYS